MFDVKISELLNTQINEEFYSAYLYLAFSNYYMEEGLEGFANWYEVQAMEERDHAMAFIRYMQNHNERVILQDIRKPEETFHDFDQPLRSGLLHEQAVTKLIHTIYEMAVSLKDNRTAEFLNWFIREQAEEEAAAGNLIKKYDLFGGSGESLYLLDRELKERRYTAAPAI